MASRIVEQLVEDVKSDSTLRSEIDRVRYVFASLTNMDYRGELDVCFIINEAEGDSLYEAFYDYQGYRWEEDLDDTDEGALVLFALCGMIHKRLAQE